MVILAGIVENFFNNFDIIKYPLLVGILLSITAAILGVVLVLKRYSMIGDGLSHVSFGVYAIALGLGFNDIDLIFIIPLVIIAAYALLRIGESKKLKSDAAIGLFSSSFLAIGYLVASMRHGGFTTDINSLMFGSIVFANKSDLVIMIITAVIVIGLFALLYQRIFAVTFDESFAKATGTNTRVYNMLFASLTAITIVIGMRIMGTLLISSIIIFPALSSMQIFKKFRNVIFFAALISVVSFLIAFFIFTEYAFGASVVCVNLVAFFICVIIGKIREYYGRHESKVIHSTHDSEEL